jgi:DNA-binding beta-propeller fold protein YncE
MRVRLTWAYRLGVCLIAVLVVVAQPLACGALAPYAASSVIGQDSFNYGYDGPQSVGQPYGISLDTSSHLLFVADQEKHRVTVFNTDPTTNKPINKTAAYVLGQPDFATTDSGAGNSNLHSPQSLLADSQNKKLYVADAGNNRIMIFDYSSGITNGMAASSVLGQPNFATTTCGTTAVKMCSSSGIAMDSVQHRLFTSEDSNSRILVFNLDANNNLVDFTADNVIGQSDFTTGASGTTRYSLDHPTSITVDDTNKRLYIADKLNSRVIIHDTTSITNGQNATALIGQADYTSSIADTTASNFDYSEGVAVDITGHRLFVSEQNNSRVLEFNLNSTNLPIDGVADNVIGQLDFTSNEWRASYWDTDSVANGQGVMFDPTNNYLYISNWSIDRIGIFDVSTITTGEDVVDLLGMDRYTSDTVIDTVHHRLFVAESHGNRVMVYNLDSNNNLVDATPDNVIGQTTFASQVSGTTASRLLCSHTCSLDYDSDRNILFVGDSMNGRVMLFDLSHGVTNGMNASYVLGKPDFTTNTCEGATQKSLCRLSSSVSYDSVNKRLFVAEYTNNRVMVFDLTTLASYKTASYVIGQPDFTTTAAGLTASQMTLGYSGMKFDSATQRLYVTDSANNRVMVFNASPGSIANGMNASYVIGQSDFVSGSSGMSQKDLSYPQGIVLDSPRQELYVFDWGGQRILRFDVSNLATHMNASAVIGQPNFTTGGSSGGTSQTAMMSDNVGMGFDTVNRRLYLPDSFNHRVMTFDFARITSSTLANASVGMAYSATINSSGTQGSVSYSLASGALPPGLSFDQASHSITGTPTQAGTYSFTISLSDNNSAVGTYTDTKSYSVVVSGGGSTSGGETTPSGDNNASTTVQSVSADTHRILGSVSERASTDEIYLNPNTSFTSVTGQTVNTTIGQTMQMQLQNGQQHTVTLKSISADRQSIVVTFTSAPQDVTLYRGVAKLVDLNSDGNPDVQATLQDTNDTSADINLRDISSPKEQSSASPSNSPQDNSKIGTQTASGLSVPIIATSVVLGAGVIAGIIMVVRKRR